jgi:hypothetical protein
MSRTAVALTTLLAGIVIALILRRLRVAVFLTVTVMLMGLLTLAPKGLAVRPRPETALAFEASTAFPSGHELGITVAVLAFTTVLWPPLGLGMRLPAIAPRWACRTTCCACGWCRRQSADPSSRPGRSAPVFPSGPVIRLVATGFPAEFRVTCGGDGTGMRRP